MAQLLLVAAVGAGALGWSTGEAGKAAGVHADSQQILVGPAAQNPNLVKVGFHNLGGAGFNGDVWVHGDTAFVGSFGVSGLCPGRGVKVIDIADPLDPALVRTLAIPAGTRTNDVKVANISTAFFSGDLLVKSNERCALGGSNGVQLWDVTDPQNPQELARFDTGPVHNAYLYQRGAIAYVLLAVPFAEVFGPGNGLPASDLQIVDVTDPANPALVGEWTIGRDAGLAFGSPELTGISGLPPGSDCAPPPGTPDLCRGQIAQVYLHDVWADAAGTTAYLSYWDAGLVTLDISDPTNPTLVSVATEPLSDEGNAHNAVPVEAANLVLVTDEDFLPGPWGFLRIFDAADPANPVEVGQFATANALAASPPDSGLYTIHNVVVDNGKAYIGWYSDGVRVVDLSEPATPTEVASFVPPDVPDPNGEFPPKALVWGVSVQNDIAYASDINGGLYVLAYDNDLDGCADLQEQSANPARGGLRDPVSFWDFFDTPDGANQRDRSVSVGDVFRIVFRFGTSGDIAIDPLSPPAASGYHTAFDRSPPHAGNDPWDLGAPDGTISVGDIFASVIQFGHSCA